MRIEILGRKSILGQIEGEDREMSIVNLGWYIYYKTVVYQTTMKYGGFAQKSVAPEAMKKKA